MRLVLIIVVALVVYFSISAYTAISLTKIPRIPLEDPPTSVGLIYEDVSFPSRVDGVTLRGWYIPGGDPSIIIVNGGWRNRADSKIGTLDLTRDLVDNGYSVLLFDFRGRGESEGEGRILTYTDRDIGGAIDYLLGREHTSLIIIGFSSGAASSLNFDTDDGVEAMVLDSCFANLHEALLRQGVIEGHQELLIKIFSPGILLMAKAIPGFDGKDPLSKVADVQCPILFIHGEIDESIPLTDAYELYQAGNNPSNAIWVVPNAGHCEGYKTDSVGYVEKVITFLEGL